MEVTSSTVDPEAAYGIIGIGNMGFGMAQNLRAKLPRASRLVICDTNQGRVEEFMASLTDLKGVTEAVSSPREVAEKATIIITSLPHAAAVRAVYTDPHQGLLSVSNPTHQILCLECSTTEIGTAADVRNQVSASGIGSVIDCPVSGGIASAAQGDLSIMVGGSQEQYALALPVLEMIGKPANIFHCGPIGHGMATKLINNYCNFLNYATLCEAMNAGVRYGLDPKLLAGRERQLPAERDFVPGFPTELAKDVFDKAVDLIDQVGAKQLFGNVLKDVYARAVTNEKCAGREHRSIYKMYSENEGEDLGTVVME